MDIRARLAMSHPDLCMMRERERKEPKQPARPLAGSTIAQWPCQRDPKQRLKCTAPEVTTHPQSVRSG
jgi:hypothetical protein